MAAVEGQLKRGEEKRMEKERLRDGGREKREGRGGENMD